MMSERSERVSAEELVPDAALGAYRFADETVEAAYRRDVLARDRVMTMRWGVAIGLAFVAFAIIDAVVDPGGGGGGLRLAWRMMGLALAWFSWRVVRLARDRWLVDLSAAAVFVFAYALFAVSEHWFPSPHGEAVAYHLLYIVALFVLFPIRLDWAVALAVAKSAAFVAWFAHPPHTTVGIAGVIPPTLIALVFSAMASASMHRTRRREWLASSHLRRVLRSHAELARTDPLTGAYNRRGFVHLAEGEVARQGRDGSSSGLLMVDLDHFKRVNDRFGHETGDLALRALVGIMRTSLRPYDVVGRWGGEEFVVLLPGLGAADSVEVGERLRRAVHEIALPDDAGHLTVSIGVTGLSPDEDILQAIERADRAMYAAKRSGRDRVSGPVTDTSDSPAKV